MKARKILCGGLICTMVLGLPGYQTSAQEKSGESVRAVAGESITCSVNSWHNGAEIEKAFDGDRNSFWDAAWDTGDTGLGVTPITVDVEFDSPKEIVKFVYTPRQDDNPNGQILKYSLAAETETGEEIILEENGTWADDHNDKEVNVSAEERLTSVTISITEGSMQGATSPTAATAAEFTFYERVLEAGISQDTMALTTGESGKLSLTEAEGTEVNWTSSNPEAADVAPDGTVTGVSEGTATVTGTTEMGETASCEVSVSDEAAPERDGYMLVFEDNFDGDSLDTTKWNNWCVDLTEAAPFRYGNSPEVAVHPDNAYVKDGTLRLLGSKEETTFDGQTSQYRSGMVQTRDKYEFKYGYMETMIKIPDVAGTNPAIWMMPQAGENSGEWLWGDKENFGAEIDILERPHPDGAPEYAGLSEKYQITIHYDNYAFTNHDKYHTEPSLSNPYKWHKFAMEWTPDYIKFIVDDEVKAVQQNDVPNTPEIFILSYGLGGWIGQIDDNGLPAEMEVDYVRWYQSIDDIESTVSLDQSEITIGEGAQEQLTAVINPEGADKVVKWESSDSSVAEVDENGLVTGVKEGAAYITAVTRKNQSASCKVIVTAQEEEPGTDTPGTEDPGTVDPGTETPGTEDPGTVDPGTEAPGTDHPGTDNPGTEAPGTEDPGTDNSGTEAPGIDQAGNKKPGTVQTSGKTDKNTSGSSTVKSVKTGDETGIWLWAAAVLLSGSVCISRVIVKKRKNQ